MQRTKPLRLFKEKGRKQLVKELDQSLSTQDAILKTIIPELQKNYAQYRFLFELVKDLLILQGFNEAMILEKITEVTKRLEEQNKELMAKANEKRKDACVPPPTNREDPL